MEYVLPQIIKALHNICVPIGSVGLIGSLQFHPNTLLYYGHTTAGKGDTFQSVVIELCTISFTMLDKSCISD